MTRWSKRDRLRNHPQYQTCEKLRMFVWKQKCSFQKCELLDLSCPQLKIISSAFQSEVQGPAVCRWLCIQGGSPPWSQVRVLFVKLYWSHKCCAKHLRLFVFSCRMFLMLTSSSETFDFTWYRNKKYTETWYPWGNNKKMCILIKGGVSSICSLQFVNTTFKLGPSSWLNTPEVS